MIPLLESAKLATDLDANLFAFLNLGAVSPPPPNLAPSTDPRLTDAREPLPGSVTDASVAVGAGIVQSKLNLDGNIPPAWLGFGSGFAAPGDQVEYVANKGQPNGYASLDSGGKIPAGQVPTAVGTGTVTSIGITMPAQFSISGSPVTGAGTLGVSWAAVADLSWFGNKSGGAAAPQFYTTPLPPSLIPSLDTSIVTTGVFDPLRLPAAVGIGAGHAPGAVPDPGPSGGGALSSDYLSRDMSFKPVPTGALSYQPGVLTPTLTPSGNVTGARTVVFDCLTPDAQLFYSVTSALTGFAEVPKEGISLPGTATVWCYGSKQGYNNSAMASYTNPNP